MRNQTLGIAYVMVLGINFMINWLSMFISTALSVYGLINNFIRKLRARRIRGKTIRTLRPINKIS